MDARFKNVGPRRYCSQCKKQVSTHAGRYAVHFDAATGKACPNSDQRVPREPDDVPDMQPDLRPATD